eukprot:13785089-Alexandrium_andersonii.AAC.1
MVAVGAQYGIIYGRTPRAPLVTATTPSWRARSTGSSPFLRSPRPLSLPTRPEVAAACRGGAAPTARVGPACRLLALASGRGAVPVLRKPRALSHALGPLAW